MIRFWTVLFVVLFSRKSMQQSGSQTTENPDEEIARLREEVSVLNATVTSLLDEKYGPCPNIHYKFPTTPHLAHVRYMPRFPHLQRATFCSWIHVTDFSKKFGIASYASSRELNNDLLVGVKSPTHMELFIHGYPYKLAINLQSGNWTHVCVWFDSYSAKCGTYTNGRRSDTRYYDFTKVTGGGSFILAHDQDSVGGGLDRNQALRGSMKNMMIWPRVLSASEIEGIAFSCTCPKDYAVAMTPDKVEMVGNVIYSVGDVCPTV